MATVAKLANANTVVTTGWTAPTNAYADDSVFATCAPAQSTSVTSDFGFPAFTTADIPNGAAINSVTVEMQFKSSTLGSTGALIGIQAMNGSTAVGAEKTGAMATAETIVTQAPTLGAALTLADLRVANKVKARVRGFRGTSATAITWSLDYVRVTVDYTVVSPIAFSDSFDTQIDPAKWPNTSAAVVWDASGQARIPCETAYWSMATPSAGSFNLTGAAIFAKVTCPAQGTGTRETVLDVLQGGSSQDKLSMFNSGGTLYARKIVANVNQGQQSIAYNASAMQWWRIRELSGTAYFEYSADGLAWVLLWSVATGIVVTNVWINFSCGYYGTETADSGFVDNVNVQPSTGTTYQGSLTAPFTFAATTQGRLKQRGQTITALTFGAVVAGVRKVRGSTITPLTFAATTRAQPQTRYGSSVAAFTFGATTSGRRRTTSSTASPYTFGATHAGVRRAVGTTSMPIVFAATHAARRRTTGSTSTPIVFGATHAARRRTTSSTTTPLIFNALTRGMLKDYDTLDARFTFGATTAARRTLHAGLVAALALRFDVAGVGASGAKTYFGSTHTALSFAAGTAARRTVFGSTVARLTFDATTRGKRTVFGSTTSALRFDATMAARKTALSFTVFPITCTIDFAAVSIRSGTSVLNYADDVRWGTKQADVVFVGTDEVWTPR